MSYPDPQAFWARTYGTRRRQMWVHGRDLVRVGDRYGSEHNARPTAFIGDTPLQLDDMRPNNEHGPNRAIRECLRFWLPNSLSPGEHTVTIRRNDGAECQVKTVIRESKALPYIVVDGRFNSDGEIVEPIHAPPNSIIDLGGRTIRPAKNFVGGALVIAPEGARISNGSLSVPEDGPNVRPIQVNGANIQLRDLRIHNEQRNGIGVFLGNVTDSEFINLQMVAERHWELFPGYQSRRNVFSRVDMSGPRGSADSDCGRGMGGDSNLIAWCQWHDLDRGPTIQAHGTPINRMLFWECDQARTGYSQGASEGLLFEAGGFMVDTITRDGRLLVNLSACPANERAKVLQAGNVVCSMNGNQEWKRIIRAERVSEIGFLITIDSPFLAPTSKVFVGSAITECTIARSRFSFGKVAICAFGPSLDLHLVQNQLTDLDNGIVKLGRTEPTAAFHWDFDFRATLPRDTRDKEGLVRRVFSPVNTISKPEEMLVGG
jgi:hypothetical protein